MRTALASGGPAVAGSAITVTLALLTLLFASLGGNRSIGWTSALGVVVVVVCALVVLPAALGPVRSRALLAVHPPRRGPRPLRTAARGPASPGPSSPAPPPSRPHPWRSWSSSPSASPAPGSACPHTEQFRVTSESAAGLETLARHFPAGASSPAEILTARDAAPAVVDTVATVPGVVSARVSDRGGDVAQVDAVLEDLPGTAASYDTIRAVRAAVADVPGADAAVGGSVATALDTREAAIRDLAVIVPMILAVVFVVLILLLRSLVAPLLLIATVILSFFAALGASHWAFVHLFGFPALDTVVPLLAFLFLVALGVDYNIFLTTRAREEAQRQGTRAGIVTAVAVDRRRHHQRGHPAGCRVHRARRAAADHPDPDRHHRRLRRAAGHVAGAHGARAGTGDAARPAGVVAQRPQPRGRRRSVGSARPRRRHAGPGAVRGGRGGPVQVLRERGHSLCAG